MKNGINIAELLQSCTKGMELDCTVYDNVTLEFVDNSTKTDYPICIRTKSGFETRLTKYGQNINNDDAKCVIFPKGKTTWEGFVPLVEFKDGDIVATASGNWVGITEGGNNKNFIPTYCVLKSDGEFEAYFDTKETGVFYRLATEEEKQKLFQVIKDNGYKWNAETKTLDKIVEPKFKVGARIKQIGSSRYYIINTIEFDRYVLNNNHFIRFRDEHMYELDQNRFDITTLIPFESRVLVRNTQYDDWKPAIYGVKKNSLYSVVGGNSYRQCIPYECNRHLLGTTKDCDEFYKTWNNEVIYNNKL